MEVILELAVLLNGLVAGCMLWVSWIDVPTLLEVSRRAQCLPTLFTSWWQTGRNCTLILLPVALIANCGAFYMSSCSGWLVAALFILGIPIWTIVMMKHYVLPLMNTKKHTNPGELQAITAQFCRLHHARFVFAAVAFVVSLFCRQPNVLSNVSTLSATFLNGLGSGAMLWVSCVGGPLWSNIATQESNAVLGMLFAIWGTQGKTLFKRLTPFTMLVNIWACITGRPLWIVAGLLRFGLEAWTGLVMKRNPVMRVIKANKDLSQVPEGIQRYCFLSHARMLFCLAGFCLSLFLL